MKKLSICTILISVYSVNVFALCDKSEKALSAEYKITIQGHDEVTDKSFKLWRYHDQVAHQYTDSKITELWENNAARMRLVRYFDAHKRAIEYQPEELGKAKSNHDWALKYQLLSDSLLTRLTKDKVIGQGCELVEHYSLTHEGRQVKVQWLPNQSLVKLYEDVQPNSTQRWELTNVHRSEPEIKSFFVAREQYQSTDYADVGDNESDPFLLNMINLGYVEHGASGFYNAEGHELEGGAHHHHHKH